MKPVTRILIGTVGLITLVPIRLGISSWLAQSTMCDFFGFERNTPDLDKLFVLTGGFILTLAVFQILTIIWLVKEKTEGFLMASIVGYTSIIRGVIMLYLLGTKTTNNILISVLPIVFGVLIVILTNMARKEEKLT